MHIQPQLFSIHGEQIDEGGFHKHSGQLEVFKSTDDSTSCFQIKAVLPLTDAIFQLRWTIESLLH